jgi:hypothetical protein
MPIQKNVGNLPNSFYLGRQGTSEDVQFFATEVQAHRWFDDHAYLKRLWRLDWAGSAFITTELKLIPAVDSKLVAKGESDHA